MFNLFLTRSKKGHLQLHSKLRFIRPKRRGRRVSDLIHLPRPIERTPIKMTRRWISYGQLVKVNDFPGSEEIEYGDFPRGVRIVPTDDNTDASNIFWITRELSGRLMFHCIKPTRMRDSERWKRTHTKEYKEYYGHYGINQPGNQWTAWGGHFRLRGESEWSRKITFQDPEPVEITLELI